MDDAETLYAALQQMKDEKDLISKLMVKLGWSNRRVGLAAQELKAQGRIRATVTDTDGGEPNIMAIEV